MDELVLAAGAAGEHAVFIGANPFLEVDTISFRSLFGCFDKLWF